MRWITFSMAAVITCGVCGWTRAADAPTDAAMARAEAFVEQSDKYLHHRHLQRGMRGYGLSVFSGTKIEKFDVEIISIVRGFPYMPQRDVILAKLSGRGLEKSRVVEGMSGSPVYVKDPRDGKDKLVGAVAFGWSLSTEPQCGLQPITQMLAMPGVLPEESKPATSQPTTSPTSQPKTTTQPTTRPAKKIDSSREDSVPTPPAWDSQPVGRMSPRAFLNIALQPGKGTFDELSPPIHPATGGGQLRPLAVPICVSGCDADILERLSRQMEPVGLRPIAAGALPGEVGFGGLDAKQLDAVKLQPGSAVSIALVTGDQDWTGVGTVTDVLDDTVLAFGHSMFGAGNIRLPMGTAYIHQVIRTLRSSFKLGSAIRNVGALTRDEEVAVAGRIGPKVDMIPMTVAIHQVEDGRKQTFHYNLARQRYYTPRLAAAMVDVSAYALRSPPIEHYIRYEVRIDFGDAGEYHAVNVATDEQGFAVISDTARPIFAMMNNPFGPAPKMRRVEVSMAIYKGSLRAKLLDVKLNGAVYRPGQKVTGTVLIEPYRQKRLRVPISLKLPEDLPDGDYPLTVGDVRFAETLQRREHPQDFAPRTVPELLEALNRIVQPRGDRMYLHIPIHRGGLAVGTQKLPAFPGGKARTLQQAKLPDVRSFQTSLLRDVNMDYILEGQAKTTIAVRRETNETILREK
ncbi:MAG: hypothetical protein JXA11_08755 [Phycisphaerae bacterium]|nr:hypothetical protein [Phycisphaerae bacterium]